MSRWVAFLFLILLTAGAQDAFAADHYIRAGASGNGSDWANALPSLPASLVRGDTYYIADGTYPGYIFDDPTSGNTYIYIKKATAAAHGTDTGWSAAYGDGQALFNTAASGYSSTIVFITSYYDFDGVVGGLVPGVVDTYGFKVNIPSRTQGRGIYFNPYYQQSYINVRHVDVDGLSHASSSGHDGIYLYYTDHIRIQYVYVHHLGRVQYLIRQTTDSIIEYNFMERNKLYVPDHGEAISAMYGCARNIVRHSVVKDCGGTGQFLISGNDWEIYGNLFYWTGAGYHNNTDVIIGNWSNGDDSDPLSGPHPFADFGSSRTKVYNNTMVDITTDTPMQDYVNARIYFQPWGTANEVRNNLWVNCRNSTLANIQIQSANTFSGSTSLFQNYSGDQFDLASATASGTILGAPYDIDVTGSARAVDGLWDRGAHEFEGVGGPTGPSPPSNLRAVP